MTEMTDAAEPPKRGRISLGRWHVVGLACLPLLVFALFFARFTASGRILGKVRIAGADVSGRSRNEAEQLVSERGRALARNKLRLALGSASTELSAAELGIAIDVANSTARAASAGRTGDVFANAFQYLRSFFVEQRLAAALEVDHARFGQAMDRAEAALVDDPPFAGELTIEGKKPVVHPARRGRKISQNAALTAISEAFARGRTDAPIALRADWVEPRLVAGSLERAERLAERLLAGPVTLSAGSRRLKLEPAELGALLVSRVRDGELELELDAARLDTWLSTERAAIEVEARDAHFEVSAADEVKIVPSEPGVRLVRDDVARALWSAASSETRQGELPLSHEPQPARSTEQARELGVRQLVGTFTTRHPCCQPRVENIHRVATLLDGLLVEPGQTVSVNAIVGPRTQKNGFVLAPSIEDGEMVDTVGGGVSQFATTFFNALFRAGYDIIERKPHTYWFPRYPMGIEATLSWPHPDIVFKNDSQAGLLVKTSFTDRTVTVKLYGDNGGRRVSFDVSERREIVQPAVELLPNRSVPVDEERVKEGGMIGWSVLVSRTVTFGDGTKKEEKRKVTYKPKARRVEVHPCRIPKGELGATGEPCPEPEPEPEAEPEAAPSAEPQPG
jgi:vancomycin resistance protein YoaR